MVEANLDDSTPQLLGLPPGAAAGSGRAGRLGGARDDEEEPAGAPAERAGGGRRKRETVTDTLLRESTTLGVRSYAVERTALERDWVEVETPWGRVRVKRGLRNGEVLNAHPEFEDCRKVAEAAGVPLKQVMAAALVALNSAR